MNNSSKVKIAAGVVGVLTVIYFFPTFLWWGILFGGGYFTNSLMGDTKLDRMMSSDKPKITD